MNIAKVISIEKTEAGCIRIWAQYYWHLRFEELLSMEAIKLFQKMNQFITSNMGKKVKSKKLTPLVTKPNKFWNSHVKTSENVY